MKTRTNEHREFTGAKSFRKSRKICFGLKDALVAQKPSRQILCETKNKSANSFLAIRKNVGEIQTGAHKRGLKPQIFREIRAKILPEKSGLFGPDRERPFQGYRGLSGADWDRFLRTSQPRGGSRNSPERAFLGPIGAFWAKPPFAKPPFGFPQ